MVGSHNAPCSGESGCIVPIGLSPVQQRHLDRVGVLASRAAATNRGQVVFIAGPPGSGRSFWVDATARALTGSRVVAGRLTDSRYVPLAVQSSSKLSPEAEKLVASIAGSAALLGPVLALVVQLMTVSVAAYRFVDGVRRHNDAIDAHQLVPGLLRTVAAEDSDRPLVCLIDDADLADGNWWANLMLSFSQEVAQELPLVLVMCVNGPAGLGGGPRDNESSACAVGRSLVQRNLAEWWPLVASSRDDIRSWIGPASHELLSAVWAITEGSPGEIPGLWDSWLARNSIDRDANDCWQIVGDVERTLAEAGDRFTAELGALLGDEKLQLLARAREILACGAVEGRTFTAEAVARALDLDTDVLIDLLDDHLTGESGPLREAASIEVLTSALTTRILWRYAFVRNLDRRIVRIRFTSGAERASLARRLAPALIEAYAPEEYRVAATLAEMFVEAGDAEAAKHFRRVANLGVDQLVLRGQARNLLTANTDGWTNADLSRAAELLLHATDVLSDVDPYSETLALATACAGFAERSKRRALQAGAVQREAELRMRLGLLESARADVMRADAILGESTGSSLEAQSALLLSQIELAHDNLQAARTETLRFRALSQNPRNPLGEAIACYQLGQIEVRMGNFEGARAPTAHALEISKRYGSARGEATALTQLALIAIRLGTFEEARSLGQQALKISQEIGDRAGEATNLFQLGLIERVLRNFETARSVTQRAIAIFQEIGGRANEAENWLQLGQIEVSSGSIDAARADRACGANRRRGRLACVRDARPTATQRPRTHGWQPSRGAPPCSARSAASRGDGRSRERGDRLASAGECRDCGWESRGGAAAARACLADQP